MLLEPARPSPAAVPFVEAAPLEAASTSPAVGADSELGGAPEAPYWGEQLPTIGLWVFVVALILTAVWRRRAAARPELRRTPKVVPTLTPTSSGASSPRSSRSVLDAPALATPVETPLQTPRSKGEDSRLTSPDRPHSISTSSGGRGRAPSISSVGSACEQYSMCSEDSETPETASEADVEDPFLSFEERFGLKESPDCQRFSIHSDSDSDDADAESSEEGPEDEEDETSWRPGEEA